MTHLHIVTVPERDERVEVWIAAGVSKRWRVCTLDRTFGEFDDLDPARELLRLLLLGDATLKGLD